MTKRIFILKKIKFVRDNFESCAMLFANFDNLNEPYINYLKKIIIKNARIAGVYSINTSAQDIFKGLKNTYDSIVYAE